MIYLDNAATTKMVPEAVQAMLPYLVENYGNPGSPYCFAERSRMAVRQARERIAEGIGALPEEIFFTSGGSESDNWALRAVAEMPEKKGRHMITTGIEHPAVLRICAWLRRQGWEITELPVEKNGILNPDRLHEAVREDTALLSVMYANNEIGTLQPVAEIGAWARERGLLFHTDAVQAYAQVPIDVERENIDMLSGSGHKFGGPKGCGFLYIRKGVKLGALIHGGGQERARRAGTENVPGIAGMGAAAQIAFEKMEQRSEWGRTLRDHLIGRVLREIPGSSLNGDAVHRLPGNVNLSFEGIESEILLIRLDQEGICASAGSACSTGAAEPSHVLKAIGLTDAQAKSAVRFTFSEENTVEETDQAADALKRIVAQLRTL